MWYILFAVSKTYFDTKITFVHVYLFTKTYNKRFYTNKMYIRKNATKQENRKKRKLLNA